MNNNKSFTCTNRLHFGPFPICHTIDKSIAVQFKSVIALQLQFVSERVFLAGFRIEHDFVHMERFVTNDGCSQLKMIEKLQ